MSTGAVIALVAGGFVVVGGMVLFMTAPGQQAVANFKSNWNTLTHTAQASNNQQANQQAQTWGAVAAIAGAVGALGKAFGGSFNGGNTPSIGGAYGTVGNGSPGPTSFPGSQGSDWVPAPTSTGTTLGQGSVTPPPLLSDNSTGVDSGGWSTPSMLTDTSGSSLSGFDGEIA